MAWNIAATPKAEILPLQALDMAASDAGDNRSTETVGDSYDNALAEAVNALHKTELICRRGPRRTVEQVELATLGCVWW